MEMEVGITGYIRSFKVVKLLKWYVEENENSYEGKAEKRER